MASEETAPTGARRFAAALARELRSHAVAYAVLALFALAGPLVVRWMFPGVSPLLGLVGGLAFGIYASLCALPGRFYE